MSASGSETAVRTRRYVAYYRASTGRQGESGLGLEAQQADVGKCVESASGELIAEFSEVVSGRKNDRRQLNEALSVCRIWKAALGVARLDRLSRSMSLITALLESGLEFEIVDFPHANRFTIHILAALAEYEWTLVSERTKAALAAAKARGVRLGPAPGIATPRFFRGDNSAANRVRLAKAQARARDLAPIVWELTAQGASREGIARELNRRGIPSPRGRGWRPSSVGLLMFRTREEFADTPDVAWALKLGPRAFRKIAGALDWGELVWKMKLDGSSRQQIAVELTRRGAPAPSKAGWTEAVVSRKTQCG